MSSQYTGWCGILNPQELKKMILEWLSEKENFGLVNLTELFGLALIFPLKLIDWYLNRDRTFYMVNDLMYMNSLPSFYSFFHVWICLTIQKRWQRQLHSLTGNHGDWSFILHTSMGDRKEGASFPSHVNTTKSDNYNHWLCVALRRRH